MSGRKILKTLLNPPARDKVYKRYNRTRQHYILQAASKHFSMRDDDPAPLFGKKLLDVGCGDSTIGEFLALSGAEITAVDPNGECLARAQTSAEAYGAPVTFIRSRAEDMLNSLSRFDVILALDLLEEGGDAGKLLWVLKQLLNPGGLIVISAINRTPKAWLVHKFLSEYVYGRVPRGSRRYRAFFTPQQLGKLAKQQGLELANVQGLSFDVDSQTWALTPQADTRYMAMLTLR
ncbi:MAG: 3-demethylubiquinone-9 3-O-methyltransferase [Pseudomonadaceae bacterium]|nr:3-demethylubiquinone-9 3-O-methyltransferase [Pseudomonadaceae bacterium]